MFEMSTNGCQDGTAIVGQMLPSVSVVRCMGLADRILLFSVWRRSLVVVTCFLPTQDFNAVNVRPGSG